VIKRWLGMSHRVRRPWFDSALGVPLDYLIHDSTRWGRISGGLTPLGGSKGHCLGEVLFYIIFFKKKKKKS
jgi:hypothetical protein